jgi:hypothetical protein
VRTTTFRAFLAAVLASSTGVAAAALVACESDETNATPGEGFDASPSTPFDAAPSPTSDATTSSDAQSDTGNDAQSFDDAGANSAALSFDGVDERVVVALPSDGGVSETAFSSELWFRSSQTSGVMSEVWDTGGGADRALYLDGGKVCFYVYSPAPSYTCTTETTFADGAWHHAAGTIGAVSGQVLYVDGTMRANLPNMKASAYNFENRFRIGQGHGAANAATTYYAGDVDEVRVWSVERTAAEVAASYKRTIPGTTTGLQIYWRLDGSGSDAVAHDSSSTVLDGTLEGFTFATSPWLTTPAF